MQQPYNYVLNEFQRPCYTRREIFALYARGLTAEAKSRENISCDTRRSARSVSQRIGSSLLLCYTLLTESGSVSSQ